MRIRTRIWNALHLHSRLRILTVGCAVATVVWGSSIIERAEAQETSPVTAVYPEFSSGMVGIASGQTLAVECRQYRRSHSVAASLRTIAGVSR